MGPFVPFLVFNTGNREKGVFGEHVDFTPPQRQTAFSTYADVH